MNIWDNAQQVAATQNRMYSTDRHARYVRKRYHSDEAFREKQLEHGRNYRREHPQKTIRSQIIDAAWEWIKEASSKFPIQSEELPILEQSFRKTIKDYEQTLRHTRQPES